MNKAQTVEFGKELDAIREEVLATRGEADANYIRKVIKTQRSIETAGRGAMLFSILPPAWFAGTALLGTSKILENMELGHNIMHGQWDWMRDPQIHSTTWEWDNVTPSASWKHSHNVLHHTYTNVVGKDRDIGYTILRMSDDQKWKLHHLFQPAYNVMLAPLFQWGIAFYDLETDLYFRGKKSREDVVRDAKRLGTKVRQQITKDYIVWPLLSGPSAIPSFFGNLTANAIRNVWTNSVIFCGHFPEDVETFTQESLEDETRGDWYRRQLAGSANIEGSKLFHVMTGNLSFQIEHHLFPDLPSNRYAEIAPKVRALCEKYDLHYETGRWGRQYLSMVKRILKHSLPTQPAPRPAVLETIAA